MCNEVEINSLIPLSALVWKIRRYAKKKSAVVSKNMPAETTNSPLNGSANSVTVADTTIVVESPSPAKTAGPRLMDKKWEGKLSISFRLTLLIFYNNYIIIEVQKKTFTKWVNMQLEKGRLQPVESLAKGMFVSVNKLAS
jgi:hypothetical protein